MTYMQRIAAGGSSLSTALVAAILVAGVVDASPALAQRTRRAAERATPVGGGATFDPARFGDLRYRMVGPARGGRVTTVTGVPSQPRTFYMGVASGGVWRTTDAGATWEPISDGQIPVGSIGSIDVAASDPNVIWVGTGSDDIRSNVSTGRGVYKSTDGGKTWSFAGLRDAGQIGAVRIDPRNPDVVYVAAIGNAFAPNAERGVFRTRDGGKSWSKVLFISDSTGAADIELQPGNPDVLYAGMWHGERKPWTIISGAREGGLYRSTDGGDHWTKMTDGLPSELIGKSNIAVSAAAPNRVYALIEAKPGGGLYRSDDAGEHWSLVNTQPSLITRPFYYTTLAADPTNADVVYGGAEGFFKSTDGGKTFQPMRVPHGDNHDMWVSPRDGNVMIQANDGGANVSLDGGRTWSTQYNQPTAEIYGVALDDRFPYRLYGAQQDNTTLIVPSLPLNSGRGEEWRTGPGCETGPIMPHPTNPDTVYGSCKGQFSRMSLRTGQEKQYWVGAQSLYGNPARDLIYRFQRVSPMEISPHDPRTIYYGSQYVHRTRDEGVTWERISPDLTARDPSKQGASGEPITRDVTGEEVYSTLYSIRESPLAKGVIWTGANDGPVHVTRDGGKTWANVTPKDLPPGGRVQTIEPSPHRPGSAYIAVYRYLLGDFAPYIYRTNDFGKTWARLTDGTNGIPKDSPTRVVREDPEREGLLYAGTEFGMYVSFDDGAHWEPFQLNLPATPVTDIRVHRGDLVLSTQGRSFWILHDITPLREWSDRLAASKAHLFAPRAAIRTHYQAGSELGAAEGPAAPQYPPPGATIDYWLASAPSGRVTLDILDASGAVVRSFSSDTSAAASHAATDAGGEDDGAPRARRGAPHLPAHAGLNRFVWDLSYPGPWQAATPATGGRGPLAVPGTYRVRLTVVDGSGRAPWTATRPLRVEEDPRVTRDGVTLADLREQFAHEMRARDLVSDVNRAVSAIKDASARLSKGEGAAADTLARLRQVEAVLVTPPVRYSKPGLQEHIRYLYGMTRGADQKVGRDALERYRTLRAELDAQLAVLRKLIPDG
ncbi:MAG TPA: hypothetical protein VFS44_13000 [Gemmatimonadaceae bacterium]|nr:hypothetical protein [Gemmatimonadaceae bacterium]